eukprot:305160_1
MTNLLGHDTYFGLIIEYLDLKFTFSSILLISKYHFNFFNNSNNKNIIKRLISTQIGAIFEASTSFTTHYQNQFTNAYRLIIKFYTDYGYIEQIAFAEYHNKLMTYYEIWNKEFANFDFINATTIDNDEEYYNPFSHQYNAIQYQNIPFDFKTLCKLQKAALLIHWLKHVINQTEICCNDLSFLYVNLYERQQYNKFPHPVNDIGICSINDYDKTNGGYDFLRTLLQNIYYFPSMEFTAVIKFILSNSSQVCFSGNIFDIICVLKKEQLVYNNYKIYVNECVKHKSFTNKKIDHRYCNKLYRNVLYDATIICDEQWNTTTHKQIMNAIMTNTYVVGIYRTIGNVLKKHVSETELCEYFNVDNMNDFGQGDGILRHTYHNFFLKLLGLYSES